MNALRHVLIIAMLIAILGLLWRILKQLEKQPPAPQSQDEPDRFNMKEFEDRQRQFQAETRMERTK